MQGQCMTNGGIEVTVDPRQRPRQSRSNAEGAEATAYDRTPRLFSRRGRNGRPFFEQPASPYSTEIGET